MQGAHIVLAQLRNEPHWMLTDADARQYGAAFVNAMRHVPIAAAQKTIDFTTLAIVVFAMEIPRIGRSIQLAKAREAPKPRGPAQVFPFANPAPTGSAPQAAGGPPSGIAQPDGLGDAAE